MVKLKSLPKSIVGKYVIVTSWGTHGSVERWIKEYGVFPDKESAEKAIPRYAKQIKKKKGYDVLIAMKVDKDYPYKIKE